MSTGSARPPTYSESMRESLIKGLEDSGQLAPGGGDMIRRHVTADRPPGQVARKVVEFLDSKMGERARMPGVEPDKVSLRRVAGMFGQVAPGKRQALADSLHTELGHLRPGEQAQRIAEKFDGDRDFAEKWSAVMPAPPPHEQQIADVLEKYFSDVLAANTSVRGLARNLGRDPKFRATSEDALVRSLAGHFSNGAIAQKHGVTQVASNDPRHRFTSAAPKEPTKRGLVY